MNPSSCIVRDCTYLHRVDLERREALRSRFTFGRVPLPSLAPTVARTGGADRAEDRPHPGRGRRRSRLRARPVRPPQATNDGYGVSARGPWWRSGAIRGSRPGENLFRSEAPQLVKCSDCGIDFALSPRRARDHRQRGWQPRCASGAGSGRNLRSRQKQCGGGGSIGTRSRRSASSRPGSASHLPVRTMAPAPGNVAPSDPTEDLPPRLLDGLASPELGACLVPSAPHSGLNDLKRLGWVKVSCRGRLRPGAGVRGHPRPSLPRTGRRDSYRRRDAAPSPIRCCCDPAASRPATAGRSNSSTTGSAPSSRPRMASRSAAGAAGT